MSFQKTPPMPGVVTAARVMLFVVSGLSGVLMVMSLLGVLAVLTHPDGAEAALAGVGVTLGGLLLSFALGVIAILLLLVAALRIGRGGERNLRVVRLLVGAGGLVSVLDAVLAGEGAAFMGVILPLIVLLLLQTAKSRAWFTAMDDASTG
ncbi:hypothetical protein [Nocardiopsis sp. MG754419]|uniref:hypothetical protein n=1 Tax=Nocardiopsis sp. MG754419 TaxID=2259865 RepID=UPI001BAB77E0|nr:hypothetical protein [Nocardiopsis sp. MG754419]MBR8740797.1 hypothetical protein [Nocardiopsis sp. MG754419]